MFGKTLTSEQQRIKIKILNITHNYLMLLKFEFNQYFHYQYVQYNMFYALVMYINLHFTLSHGQFTLENQFGVNDFTKGLNMLYDK